MTINAIDALSVTQPSLYNQKANNMMDKMDFLNLLIAQIQQQDPLNPQDPTEFTSQLAQFSSLEQMMSMNQSIQDLQLLQLSSNNTLAASFIGKDIVYSGNQVKLDTAGQATTLCFNSDQAAKDVVVTIKDSQGNTVRTLQVTKAEAGQNSVAWDGKDSNGIAAKAGTYTMSVAGKDSSGNALTLQPLQIGHVSALLFRNGQTFLKVGDKEVALGDVLSVNEPAAASAA